MTLGAIKKFNDETGCDLWVTLLKLINEDMKAVNSGLSVMDRVIELAEVLTFEKAAIMFHCMIDKSTSTPLAEIRDSMARVGWLPTDRPGDMGEPYVYVALQMAYDVNSAMEKATKEVKKKADT